MKVRVNINNGSIGKVNLERSKKEAEKLMDFSEQEKLFVEHDPLSRDPDGMVQQKFTVCEKEDLLVDHDIEMRVNLKQPSAAAAPGKYQLMSSGGFN